MEGNKLREKVVKRYSEALKLQVVQELEQGCLTVSEAMDFYDIPWRKTLNRWQRRYGKDKTRVRVVRVIMKSEKERIRELEKALADKELENIAYKALVSVYEDEHAEEMKKKLDPKRLKEFEELRARVRPLLKGFLKSSE
jgi:transposase-like protein